MLYCTALTMQVGVRDQALQPTEWEAQPPVVAQGAAAALRTRPLPQPTASSLVVESFFMRAQLRERLISEVSWRGESAHLGGTG
jgi:hypothetical protein